MVIEAAMGITIGAQENENSEYVKSVKKICQVITDRNFSVLHAKLFPLTLNYFREKRALKVIHGHTDSIIEQRIAEIKMKIKSGSADAYSGKTKHTFLDLLIQSTNDEKQLSRLDLREEVDTFMFEVSPRYESRPQKNIDCFEKISFQW